VVAEDGSGFCILFGEARITPYLGSNAFIYTDYDQHGRTIALGPVPPQDVIFAGGHVLFLVETNWMKILDYDIRTEKLRKVELPGASRWLYEAYENPHSVLGQTNIVNFAYKKGGTRLEDGKDYASGIYSLNLASGEITTARAEPQRQSQGVTGDGRYVFFEGDDEVCGHTLISSPWDHYATERDHSKAKEIRVLKTFSFLGFDRYCLEQLSPCRQFAFVRQVEQITKPNDRFGELNTYYIVNVLSGSTRVLIKDEVARKTGGLLSQIFWVGGDLVNEASTNTSSAAVKPAPEDVGQGPSNAKE
jgi:hypothetical protein